MDKVQFGFRSVEPPNVHTSANYAGDLISQTLSAQPHASPGNGGDHYTPGSDRGHGSNNQSLLNTVLKYGAAALAGILGFNYLFRNKADKVVNGAINAVKNKASGMANTVKNAVQ